MKKYIRFVFLINQRQNNHNGKNFVSTIRTVKTSTLLGMGVGFKEIVKRCTMINFGYKLKQIVATNFGDIFFPKKIVFTNFGDF